MEYLYFLENASLTLWVVKYLHANQTLPIQFVTVVNQVDGWVVFVKMNCPLKPQQHEDLRAFLHELGSPYLPQIHLALALLSLVTGQSAIDVMHRHQVAIVAHGCPDGSEIEAFCHHFARGLGYSPETLT